MNKTKTIVSNPATFFINGQDARSFTYEGGAMLFHWSPYASGLSTSMESNVIFFANDVDHARDVLRRLFEFWIKCNTKYVKYKHNQNDRHGLAANAESEIKVLNHYLANMGQMVISEVPTNQFYKVSWASNDGLDVYDK